MIDLNEAGREAVRQLIAQWNDPRPPATDEALKRGQLAEQIVRAIVAECDRLEEPSSAMGPAGNVIARAITTQFLTAIADTVSQYPGLR